MRAELARWRTAAQRAPAARTIRQREKEAWLTRCQCISELREACDASGRGFYGRSGAILLPEPVAAAVLDRGVELSHAVEAYAGVRGVRDAQGAWGVLTKNLIDRQESFRVASINAFAPFFNPELYGKA